MRGPRPVTLGRAAVSAIVAGSIVGPMLLSLDAAAIDPVNSESLLTTTLYQPEGITSDRAGDLFISDNLGHLGEIQATDLNHAVTQIASNGRWAANDVLRHGAYVYVALTAKNEIKRVAIATGTISIYSSVGLAGPSGMTFDSAGNLYVANNDPIGSATHGSIARIPPGGGSAINIHVRGIVRPYGLALVGKRLWVSDIQGNGELYLVPVTGGAATLVYTLPVPAIVDGLSDVVADPAGNIFMAAEQSGSGVIVERPTGGGPAFLMVMTPGTTPLVASGLTWTKGRLYTEDWKTNPFDVWGIDYTAPPGPPISVQAVATDARHGVTARWSTPSFDGNSPVLSYTATSSPGGASCTVLLPSLPSCVLSGLRSATRYNVSVTATNLLGTSRPSASSNTVIPN